jgi:hypothetical protein
MATTFAPHLPPTAAPVATAELVILLTPLKGRDGQWRVLRQAVHAGQTVRAVLPPGQPWQHVDISGRRIAPEAWDTAIIAPGDEIWLTPEWGVQAVPFLITLAVGIALSVATAFLFAPKPPKGAGQDDPTYTITGIRSTRGPGQPVPICYGRHRKGGQILSAFVTYPDTYIDDGSTASTAKPIESFVGGGGGDMPEQVVVFVDNHGFPAGQQIRIRNVKGAPWLNNLWTVVAPVDTHFFALGGADGLQTAGATGGEVLTEGPIREQATEKSARWNMLWGLAEGRIAEVHQETIRLNEQPAHNFKNLLIDTRPGLATQSVMEGFNDTRLTVPDGREIVSGGIIYTTSQPVDAFGLNIDFNEGLVHFLESGSQVSNKVVIEYRFRVSPSGAWTGIRQIEIVGERAGPVRFGIRRRNIATETYDIEVSLLSVGNTSSTRSRWRPTLTSITEIVNGTERYDNTALLGIRGIASEGIQGDFPNMTVEVRGLLVRVGSFAATETYSTNPAWCLLDLMTNPRYGLKLPDSAMDLPAFQTFADYCDEEVEGLPRHTLNYILDRYVSDQDAILELLQGTRAEMIHSEGKWGPRPSRDDPPVQLLTAASCWNVEIDYVRDVDAVNVVEVKYANADNDYQQDVLTWPPEANWPAQVHKETIEVRGITESAEIQRYAQYELNRRSIPRRTLTMECGLEALRLITHEIFRFAHPLPGWGISGRIANDPDNSTLQLTLDKAVLFEDGKTYHLYVRQADDTTEVRPVTHPGAGEYRTITLSTALTQIPEARLSEWSFGESAPTDTAQIRFRVKEMRRTAEMSVLIEAIEHNPSVYEDDAAIVLPPITDLPDVFGPSPPLLNLVATELQRIDIGGRVRPVVQLSWDIMDPLAGFGFYGGAIIYRREIIGASMLGHVLAAEVEAAVIQPDTDTVDLADFFRVGDVGLGILDFVHQNVVPGIAYQYRVVPINTRGLPNFSGFDEALIHVTGGTTPEFRPGTPTHLRLLNADSDEVIIGGYAEGYAEDYAEEAQSVLTAAHQWHGPDLLFTWDAPPPPEAGGSVTVSYRIDLYAPGQAYRIAGPIFVPAPGYAYTQAANSEDHSQWGMPPARQILIRVWARSDAGMESVAPAALLVDNPPPDMSGVIPLVTNLVDGLFVSWEHWEAPRDIEKFGVYVNGLLRQTVGAHTQSVVITGLTGGTGASVHILPYDTFGPGIPTPSQGGAPESATSQWPYLARSVAANNLVFSTDEVTNTVNWTGGTLTYVTPSGATEQRTVSADSAQWTGQTLYIQYPLGSTVFEASTTLNTGSERVLMAVYSGGHDLVVEVGTATVHGDNIVPQSITAANLTQSSAVITTATQLDTQVVSSAAIQDAAVTGPKIGEFAVDTNNVASNAITAMDVASTTSPIVLTTGVETVVQTLANFVTEGGRVQLTFFAGLASGSAFDLSSGIRIRKDTAAGEILRGTQVILENQTAETRLAIALGAEDEFPALLQTYVVTATNNIAGDLATMDDRHLTALNWKK